MKGVSELTGEETQTLARAQAELREKALIFANKPGDFEAMELFIAARTFSSVCDRIGLNDYWKVQGRWDQVIIPQA